MAAGVCLRSGIHRQGFHAQRTGAGGSRPRKGQQARPSEQLRAIEMLLDRGFGRSPQQLDIPHGVSNRPRERKILIS